MITPEQRQKILNLRNNPPQPEPIKKKPVLVTDEDRVILALKYPHFTDSDIREFIEAYFEGSNWWPIPPIRINVNGIATRCTFLEYVDYIIELKPEMGIEAEPRDWEELTWE